MDRYWMVHREGSSPRVGHKTKDSAVKEAMRLSSTAPNIEFVVLEAIGFVVSIPPMPMWEDVND